jgi:hypothetical protein
MLPIAEAIRPRGSASHPAIRIGKDSRKADAALAPPKISKTTPCKVALPSLA